MFTKPNKRIKPDSASRPVFCKSHGAKKRPTCSAVYAKRYMKWSFMKFLGVFLALSLSACTYSAGSGGVNSQDCSQVQRECLHGVYSEWFQKNGDLACTCSGT
jgi:hypothetical protein